MHGWLLEFPQVLYVPSLASLSGVRTHLKNLNASEKGRERQRQSLVEPGGSGNYGSLPKDAAWAAGLPASQRCQDPVRCGPSGQFYALCGQD